MTSHIKLQTPRQNKRIPSLLKWTGSKRSQALAIANSFEPYNRYLEPFLGGGALLYLACYPNSIASDIYSPLIEFWKMVQSNPELLIKDYQRQWTILQEELDSIQKSDWENSSGLPKYYYFVRDRFNTFQNPLDLNFIMRTCVNGIVRFNSMGEFNNSFHLTRRGMRPDNFRKIVDEWHKVIKGVSFLCQDYSETIKLADKNDLIYFDPPYSGSKNRYITEINSEIFFEHLSNLNRRGVKWVLSYDGKRGEKKYRTTIPRSLYKRELELVSGNSAVIKVLTGPIEKVTESLYLNY